MTQAFSPTAEWASGDWAQLFTHVYKYPIQNATLISSNIEGLLKWFTEDDFNAGADNQRGILRVSHGSSGRFARGGPTNSAATFSTYRAPSYAEFSFHLKSWVNTFEMIGQKMMRMGKGSFHGDIFEEMVQASKEADSKARGPKFFGDGNGYLCHITTANTYTASSDIPVKQWQAVVKSKTYAANYGGVRYLYPGCGICIGTAAELAANTPKAVLVVASVNSANQTFRYNGTVGPASVVLAQNDIVVAGDALGNEYGLAITGFESAINNTGTYMGINRATAGNGFWKSHIKSNSGTLTPLTNQTIYRDLATLKTSSRGATFGAKFSPKLICHDSLLFETIFAPEAIYWETQKIVPRMGYEQDIATLSFSYGATKVPVFTFEDAPYNEYMIWNSQPEMWSLTGGWVPHNPSDPSSIWALANSTDFSYQAKIYREMEMVVKDPSNYLRREDVDVPTNNIIVPHQS